MAATGRRAWAGSCLEVGAWGHTIQTSDSIPFASRRKGWNTRPRSGGTPLIDGCCSRFFPTSVWQSPTWIVHFLRWSLHCLRPKFWPGRPCGVPVRSPQPSGCNPTRSLRTSSAFSTSGSPNCSFSSPRSWDGCLTSSVHVGRPSTLPTSLRKRGGRSVGWRALADARAGSFGFLVAAQGMPRNHSSLSSRPKRSLRSPL